PGNIRGDCAHAAADSRTGSNSPDSATALPTRHTTRAERAVARALQRLETGQEGLKSLFAAAAWRFARTDAAQEAFGLGTIEAIAIADLVRPRVGRGRAANRKNAINQVSIQRGFAACNVEFATAVPVASMEVDADRRAALGPEQNVRNTFGFDFESGHDS